MLMLTMLKCLFTNVGISVFLSGFRDQLTVEHERLWCEEIWPCYLRAPPFGEG